MSDSCQPDGEDNGARRPHPHTMDREKIQRFVGEFADKQRSKLIKRFILMGERKQDAEDLVQEALRRFVEAFNDVESLPSEESCAAWLSTTTTNLFRDQLRKRYTHKKALPKLRLAHAANAPDEAEESASEALTEQKKQLEQAIRDLSPTTRAALELDAEGKSGRDIARALGIREGAARKRIHDAKKKLAAFFRRHRTPGGH